MLIYSSLLNQSPILICMEILVCVDTCGTPLHALLSYLFTLVGYGNDHTSLTRRTAI